MFLTPSGHVVVAEEADAATLVCEPKPGQTTTSLVFDHEILDCLPPPVGAPPELSEDDNGANTLLLTVLVPVSVVLFLAAATLVYRNRSLSRDLTNLRSKSMDLEANDMDLDAPLTKVTKYLGKIAKKPPLLARWLFPKTDIAEQV